MFPDLQALQVSIPLYPPPCFLISLTLGDSKEPITARLISEAKVAETNGREFGCGTRHCTQWAPMGCAPAVGLTLGGTRRDRNEQDLVLILKGRTTGAEQELINMH